jgi:beta-aspartyl-peptidase (threonine type)
LKRAATVTAPALAIHGGAGTLNRRQMSGTREKRYHEALVHVLHAGYRVLEAGGSSLDAVVAAVVELENSPLFNAGRGSVLNADGDHEMDAAVMDGATVRVGSVAAVRRIQNPVLAARAVMERTSHVMLAGPAADRFARRAGLPLASAQYFRTTDRVEALARARARKGASGAAKPSAAEMHGTVGAVALDGHGNLAAATSTGGYTNKMPGRIGDSPIVGAGVYADNETCAVSCTGHGEAFMRAVAAHDLAARMRYEGDTIAVAARHVLDRIVALGAEGGLIAIDRAGRIVTPFVSEGMYRGTAQCGRYRTGIYGGPLVLHKSAC